MTRSESTVIEKLRDELHACHVDVQKLVQRCDACRGEIVQINADIYGLPGNKDASPGLLGDVAELRRGGKLISLALRGAWLLLTILLGAVATALVQAHL
jgi:hypothetical protein